jgi:hypothetical protein
MKFAQLGFKLKILNELVINLTNITILDHI